MIKREFEVWLRFASRDLRAARILHGSGDLLNALYHLQQAAEKSLKAVIVFHSIPVSHRQFRTHNLEYLVAILKRHGVDIPNDLKGIGILTDYAFTTRYPDDYVPVSEEEYDEAYSVAIRVYEWAKKVVES